MKTVLCRGRFQKLSAHFPWYFFGLLPLLLTLCAVLLVPSVWTLIISFHDYRFGYPMHFVGFQNYKSLFQDPWFWHSVKVTILFAICALSVEFIIGLALALLLSRRFALQRVWIALLLSPYAISPVVAVATWKYMLSYDGLVNYLLSLLGISPVRWLSHPILAFFALIIVDVWLNYPFIMLIMYSAISSIPQEMFEAPLIDGASGWQRFRYVFLPLLSPAIFVAITFRIIFILRTFDIPWLMTQGGPIRATEVLAIYLYRYGFRFWDFGMGSAVGWVMLLFTLLFSCGYIRAMYKKTVY